MRQLSPLCVVLVLLLCTPLTAQQSEQQALPQASALEAVAPNTAVSRAVAAPSIEAPSVVAIDPGSAVSGGGSTPSSGTGTLPTTSRRRRPSNCPSGCVPSRTRNSKCANGCVQSTTRRLGERARKHGQALRGAG
jgi:hypothetical protein